MNSPFNQSTYCRRRIWPQRPRRRWGSRSTRPTRTRASASTRSQVLPVQYILSSIWKLETIYGARSAGSVDWFLSWSVESSCTGFKKRFSPFKRFSVLYRILCGRNIISVELTRAAKFVQFNAVLLFIVVVVVVYDVTIVATGHGCWTNLGLW